MRKRMPPRCCHAPGNEFQECYASVLVYGRDPACLERAVLRAESQSLASCFTAWCPQCYRSYLLCTDLDKFPCPSAHHTHKLQLLDRLRESGIYYWQADRVPP